MHNYVKAQRVPYYIYSLRGTRQLRANIASASPSTHTHARRESTPLPSPGHAHTRAHLARIGVLPHCATLAGLPR